VATILLAGVDPIFARELRELLARHRLTSTESVELPDLVIADIGRIEPDEVSDAYPETPILGFAGHADPSILRAAREAGLDRVIERAALIQNAEDFVSEFVAG
jgi:hypothetical protein